MSDARPATGLTVRRTTDGVLLVELAGDWVAQSGIPGLRAIEKELAGGGITALAFDASGLGRWDSGLVALLFKCLGLCEKNQIEFRAETLPDGLAKLIALSQAVPEKKDAAREHGAARRSSSGSASRGWRPGRAARHAQLHGRERAGVPQAAARPGAVPLGRTRSWSCRSAGPQALGIVALINFLIGLILAFVGATELARFGASIYTADLVAVATVREMGCIMTGIIICGRTGAAFAAQLGTMKVNQEIEAFQTFGISPVEFLVLPRMLALILMMPLLCIFADLIAIAGGFLVSTLMLDVAPVLYLNRTVECHQPVRVPAGHFQGRVLRRDGGADRLSARHAMRHQRRRGRPGHHLGGRDRHHLRSSPRTAFSP